MIPSTFPTFQSFWLIFFFEMVHIGVLGFDSSMVLDKTAISVISFQPQTFLETQTAAIKKNRYCTPLKIIMEPKNRPIEKENHLNQTSILFRGFKDVNFAGVYPTKVGLFHERWPCFDFTPSWVLKANQPRVKTKHFWW